MPASLLKQANEYSEVQRKLTLCKITLDKIVDKSGVSKPTVSRVLDLNKFSKCNYAAVTKVRQAILELKPSFVTMDFDEYDNQIVIGDDSA